MADKRNEGFQVANSAATGKQSFRPVETDVLKNEGTLHEGTLLEGKKTWIDETTGEVRYSIGGVSVTKEEFFKKNG